MHDARIRAKSGEWDDASSSTVVGLYAVCHELVYGCVPAELAEKGTFRNAVKTATRFCLDYFGGEPNRMVAFIKWVWKREGERLKTGRQFSRIGWRLQFSAFLFTDWRAASFASRRGPK